MTNQSAFEKVMAHAVAPDLVRGFQSQWDGEQCQNHYALRSDGVVLECAKIPYPSHISNFGGIGREWVVSSLKSDDFREMEFIGYYAVPKVSK